MKLGWLLLSFVIGASAQSPTDLNESLRRTFAKITAWGETARTCSGVLANDQSQLREVAAKIRDAQDRHAALARDFTKLETTRPQPPTYNIDIKQIKDQDANNNALLVKLAAQETSITNDVAVRQKCIDLAHEGLNGILADPAKPIPDPPKKK